MPKSRFCMLVVAFVLPIVSVGFLFIGFSSAPASASSPSTALLSCASSGFAQDSPGYSSEEALKVIQLIEKIQLEQLENESREAHRSVEVTESEFNSYVAYRIEVEKEDVLKELRVKFFEGNRIEGKIVVDLRKQKLPKFLKPQMTFFLGGQLEVKDGEARLKRLFR
jgi:hypothetical protein